MSDYDLYIKNSAAAVELFQLYDAYDAILREKNLIEYADQELGSWILSKEPILF